MAIRTKCLVHTPHFAKGREYDAYLTKADSLFAVTRPGTEARWTIAHRGSGGFIGSLLDAPRVGRPHLLRDLLAVVTAWEADATLDLSAFRKLTTFGGTWAPRLSAPSSTTVQAMREIARATLNRG